MRAAGRLAALTLAVALFAGSAAARAADVADQNGIPWQDEMVLLGPDTDPAARAAMLARTVAAAEAGHSDAAFLLGALYRSGERHPAKAVARDLDQARCWLERCIELPRCSPVVLYSLAELELEAGNAARAMQWAQLAAIFDREIAKEVAAERRMTSGYLPGLLSRAFAALPKAQRSDENVQALISALVKERGDALDRMLEHEIVESKRTPEDSDPWPKVPNRTFTWNRRRQPDGELYALFVAEIPAAGGRASRVVMAEGLPRPRAASVLEPIAVQEEFLSYTPRDGAASTGAWLPITFDTRRYTLKAK